ncbi:hypothetical protein E2562_019007 [Oryza meyeriana var. granulata]|uniref:Uncharacterized protein n=1 Tax=Oryza meyeriana var. granulata TaxID=110450 RepID=A0A6G1DIX7_9ORYZ|nr:hypothetical protein E2562_019007 [Oryza meyeriana var. granulata]KAF0912770.1 hypothetical protein E2562_019007 [Oryza meyeriana var. granulata]KAF0912771.1 hypothetical protein E2562_019007 [Oryza meyeriana var. granulata]KAF0912772.1 hypothetical protein E2562_019007 [Oryza meyeriana var. granulata]KAF0912773.1 hypothetical protein E2562_019007 [Oryza meyeriana var. granulata]
MPPPIPHRSTGCYLFSAPTFALPPTISDCVRLWGCPARCWLPLGVHRVVQRRSSDAHRDSRSTPAIGTCLNCCCRPDQLLPCSPLLSLSGDVLKQTRLQAARGAAFLAAAKRLHPTVGTPHTTPPSAAAISCLPSVNGLPPLPPLP